ncbi:MAG TPA: hypothetical protein VGF55_19485 [Gemmataceae bacterium]
MVDDAADVRHRDVGPPLGRVTGAVPDVLPRVGRNVAEPRGVFEELAGQRQPLVNGGRPQPAGHQRFPERLAVRVGQAGQGPAPEQRGQVADRLPPDDGGRGRVPGRPLADQPAVQVLADGHPLGRFDQPGGRQAVAEGRADAGQPDGRGPRDGLAANLRGEQGFDVPGDAVGGPAVALAQADGLAAPVRGHEQNPAAAAGVIANAGHGSFLSSLSLSWSR